MAVLDDFEHEPPQAQHRQESYCSVAGCAMLLVLPYSAFYQISMYNLEKKTGVSICVDMWYKLEAVVE